ncbi:hypothetical protein [Ichthyenterobacterium magnum]|uniref:TonB-like protein n=1 Tax=Ichthyenterobacterium magnum TaxID=1230530 RepID=A0A420DW67_9FLAO|nr:hypothetical protein [Ichthyenterobacterium magnum]RKE98467.1 hypothetical protein BXY80_0555 [Ichthyenterobacterium magnum]
MKQLLLIFCLVLLSSCNYFNTKKVYTEDLLEEELQTFNWNDVDEYPTFAICDSTLGKSNKKVCFENTLRNILNTNLSKYKIIVNDNVDDTIQLKITISNTGKFSIDNIISKAVTKAQIPQLDSLVISCLDTLPKIYPAIKRSQQVATQFSLPIVVKID